MSKAQKDDVTWEQLAKHARELEDAGRDLWQAAELRRPPRVSTAVQFAMNAAFASQRLLGRFDDEIEDPLDRTPRNDPPMFQENPLFDQVVWSKDADASGPRSRAFVRMYGIFIELVAYDDGRWFIERHTLPRWLSSEGRAANPKHQAWLAAVGIGMREAAAGGGQTEL